MQNSSLQFSSSPSSRHPSLSTELPISHGNQDRDADIEANRLPAHNVSPRQADLNQGQRLRDIFGGGERSVEVWKPYVPERRAQLEDRPDENRCLDNVCKTLGAGTAGAMTLGFLGGMLSFYDHLAGDGDNIGTHFIRDFGIGAAIGGTTMISLYWLERWCAPARPGMPGEANALNPMRLGYDQLAIGDNLGIANAPCLDEALRNKLTGMLAKVQRSPRYDKTVQDLIRILHAENPAGETQELIDKLKIIIDDYDQGCGVHGEVFLERAKGPIATWKLARQNPSVGKLLAKGVKAARADVVAREQAHLHDRGESVPAYLAAHRNAIQRGRVQTEELPSILAFMGTYDPWQSYVRRTRGELFAAHEALIRDVVQQVDGERPQLEGQSYLTTYQYLKDAYESKLLLQWYARESFANERFLETADDSWLRATLMAEFSHLGLSASRIGEIFDEVRAQRDQEPLRCPS